MSMPWRLLMALIIQYRMNEIISVLRMRGIDCGLLDPRAPSVKFSYMKVIMKIPLAGPTGLL